MTATLSTSQRCTSVSLLLQFQFSCCQPSQAFTTMHSSASYSQWWSYSYYWFLCRFCWLTSHTFYLFGPFGIPTHSQTELESKCAKTTSSLESLPSSPIYLHALCSLNKSSRSCLRRAATPVFQNRFSCLFWEAGVSFQRCATSCTYSQSAVTKR